MKKQTAKIEKFKLSQLREAGYNPRTISEEAYAALAKSIEKFGCVQPILINTKNKNTIIGGNQRYKILLEKHGPGHECYCVTVKLSKVDEKLLNITLNNPKCQGEFVQGLAAYIDKLREELEDKDIIDLKINELTRQIGTGQDSQCSYKEERLKPYKKTHILISFEPKRFAEIAEHLEAIIKTEGIEYEQCSN